VRFVCVSVGVPVECGTQAEIRIQARKHAQTRTTVLWFSRDMFSLPPNRAGKKFAPNMGGLLSRDPIAYEQLTLLSATCRDPKGLMEIKRTKQSMLSIRALCVRVLAFFWFKSRFVRFVCVYVSWCAGRVRHTSGISHTSAKTRTSTQPSTINARSARTCVSIRVCCVRGLALCACASWFVRFVCVCMSVGVPGDCGTQAEICIHARKHARAHKQAPLTHQTQARVCQFAFVVCVCVCVLCARMRAGLCDLCVCVSVGVPDECGTQAEIRIQARKHAQAHKQAQTRTSILRFLRDMFLLPPNRAGKKFAP
jgi:muconolactone delta-isomerase